MKKILVLFLVLFCVGFADAKKGDGFGNHKARKDIDLQNNAIKDGSTSNIDGVGIFNVGLSTSTNQTLAGRAGEDLVKGQAVYQSGVLGNNLIFSLADRTSATHEQAEAIGLCFLTANNNQPTLVLVSGTMLGVKTNYAGWATNDELFLDLDGNLTDVKTSSGTFQFIGYVGRVHATVGSIIVAISHPEYRLVSPITEDVIIRAGVGMVTRFEDDQGNQFLIVRESSSTYAQGYIVRIDTIRSSGNRLDLVTPTSFYGSSWWNGYDVKGIDRLEVNSILWPDGTVQESSPTAGGGGSGNVNRDIMIPAELFKRATNASGNVASLKELQIEYTYDNVLTTRSIITIKLPDASNHNFATTKGYTSLQWDDATFIAKIPFVTTGTHATLNTWLTLGISTSPDRNYTVYESTTSTGNGVNDVRFATFTVSGIIDGYPLYIGVGRHGNDDPADMEIHAIGAIVDPDAD